MLLPVNSNDIFLGIISPIFLCFFFQERLYNPRLYVLLMYLVASRDYSREDRCNPLLLIVEVWTRLGPMVFPFALGGFLRKNYGLWFIFCCMSLFIFTTSCYYLFNFTQRNGRKILIFVGILWIHPNMSPHKKYGKETVISCYESKKMLKGKIRIKIRKIGTYMSIL